MLVYFDIRGTTLHFVVSKLESSVGIGSDETSSSALCHHN